eukprot:598811_1
MTYDPNDSSHWCYPTYRSVYNNFFFRGRAGCCGRWNRGPSSSIPDFYVILFLPSPSSQFILLYTFRFMFRLNIILALRNTIYVSKPRTDPNPTLYHLLLRS